MATILTNSLASRDAYRLLASVVIPRPIAWVSSMSADGVRNLAPYSFFNAVSGNPPMVMFSVSNRRGSPKDTLRNIEETKEFVVNIVDLTLAEAMNETAGEWDFEVDEFDLAKLETAASTSVKPPRVAAAPVAMEAKLTQILPLAGSDSTLVFGEVICFHLQDNLLTEAGLLDANKASVLARLGGAEYSGLGPVFAIERPTRQETHK